MNIIGYFYFFNNVKRGNKLKSRKGVARMEKHFVRLESAFFMVFLGYPNSESKMALI